MKRNEAIKRILALMTAPTLFFPAPHPLRCEENRDGAVLLAFGEAEITQTELSFLSDTFFFGESTTAHLARVGGILDTDSLRRRVWRDQSGTRMLDRRTLHSSVDYIDPEGERHTISFEEAVRREQPRRLVLSFGLNGLLYFHQNTNSFIGDYRRLLLQIRELSPNTDIFLQSVYPIGENGVFSEPVKTLNTYIDDLNVCLSALADTMDRVTYVDTASLLCDKTGALAPSYDQGDGIHLTNEAYQKILHRLATYLE